MKQRFCSVVFGSVMLMIGLLFVWEGIPHTNSVICERAAAVQIDCQKQERVLWWIPVTTDSLQDLQAVGLEKGENTENDTVYFIALTGEINKLTFGHTLDAQEIETDLHRAQQFLQQSQASSLHLERYRADWVFALIGLPIAALGFWSFVYRYD